MGGFGSGRRGGRPKADSSLRIDIAWMVRNGRAKDGAHISGTLHWTRGGQPSGTIGYRAIMTDPGNERLELSYSRGSGNNQEQVKQTVRLCFTRPHYGGKRWWMICPYRGIRVGILYLPPGGDRFASRQAWRLGYHIQRLASHERASERLFRLQRKLGGEMGLEAFPTRPKGMWHRTWQRHLLRFWELEEAAESEFQTGLARILGRHRSW